MSYTRKRPFLWLTKSPLCRPEPASSPSESGLKVMSVLALPKDRSLLNSKGRTEEDKTRRRLGLPGHVPPDWPGFGDYHPELLLDPQDHVTPEMLADWDALEEGPLIRAGSPRRTAASECSTPGSHDDEQTRGNGDACCDTTYSYSYVLPERVSMRRPASSTSGAHLACDGAHAQPAPGGEPAFKPLRFEEIAGAKQLPCDCATTGAPASAAPSLGAAQDSTAGASARGGALGGASAFPELLPQQVLRFAELPLKPLPPCASPDAPTPPLTAPDHPWLSSGAPESADWSGRPSACSVMEDRRIELLPGPGPDLARQESAPAGAVGSQRGGSLVASLSLPAGYVPTMKAHAAAAPAPASRVIAPEPARSVQAGQLPTPGPPEAAQAAVSRCLSAALIAEEAARQMIRRQLLCLVARAAGLVLLLLLMSFYITAIAAMRSSYLGA